jgi:hypothetical protein
MKKKRIPQPEYVTLIAGILNESLERVEVAVLSLGRNYEAIRIFLFQNRGHGNCI